jgi:hypothetical protein
VPTCAVCFTAIMTPQRFVISGTEAVHATCARTGRQTVLQQTRQALARAQEEAATSARKVAELELKVSDLERREQSRITDGLAQRRRNRVYIESMQREIDQARAERDAARAAADTRAQQAVAPAAPSAPAPTPGQINDTDRPEIDDTSVRMALLELDPL